MQDQYCTGTRLQVHGMLKVQIPVLLVLLGRVLHAVSLRHLKLPVPVLFLALHRGVLWHYCLCQSTAVIQDTQQCLLLYYQEYLPTRCVHSANSLHKEGSAAEAQVSAQVGKTSGQSKGSYPNQSLAQTPHTRSHEHACEVQRSDVATMRQSDHISQLGVVLG